MLSSASQDSLPSRGNRVALLRLAIQLGLFILLFGVIGRFEAWRLILSGGLILAVLPLALRPRRRLLAEAMACVGTLGLTLELALDPPGASPIFALALFSAACFSVVLAAAPHRFSSRGGRWLTRLGLLGLMLFASLSVAELWARSRFPRAPHGIVAADSSPASTPYVKVPELIHVQAKNFRGYFVHPEYDQEPYETNDEGFRDQDWPDSTSTDEPLILCLGDSTMVGFGVRREEAIPALLQAELSKDMRVRVLNGATAGYGPRHILLLLEKLLVRLRPALVVVGFYDGNDLDDARSQLVRSRQNGVHDRKLSTEQRGDQLVVFKPPRPSTLLGRAYWSKYSQFFRRLESRVLIRVPGMTDIPPEHAYFRLLPSMAREPDELVLENHALSLDAFREMARLCESSGARLLVLRIPARIQTEEIHYQELVHRSGGSLGDYDRALPGSKIMTDCKELGIDSLDLLPLFDGRNGSPTPALSPFYYREGHPNRLGCAVAAQALAERIRASDLLGQVSRGESE